MDTIPILGGIHTTRTNKKRRKKTQTNTEMCPKKMEKLKDEMIK